MIKVNNAFMQLQLVDGPDERWLKVAFSPPIDITDSTIQLRYK